MVEFVAGIILLIAFISGRKIMQEYLIVASDRTSLWAKDIENSLQSDVKRIHDERADIISKNGKWLTVSDIDKLR